MSQKVTLSRSVGNPNFNPVSHHLVLTNLHFISALGFDFGSQRIRDLAFVCLKSVDFLIENQNNVILTKQANLQTQITKSFINYYKIENIQLHN